jgi:hypothetical protein
LNREDSSSTSSETEATEQEDRGKEFLKAYFSSDSSENSALTASLLAQVSADDPSVAASLGLLYDYYVQESAQSPNSPNSERYIGIHDFKAGHYCIAGTSVGILLNLRSWTVSANELPKNVHAPLLV